MLDLRVLPLLQTNTMEYQLSSNHILACVDAFLANRRVMAKGF